MANQFFQLFSFDFKLTFTFLGLPFRSWEELLYFSPKGLSFGQKLLQHFRVSVGHEVFFGHHKMSDRRNFIP